jgi:hypothetical protein
MSPDKTPLGDQSPYDNVIDEIGTINHRKDPLGDDYLDRVGYISAVIKATRDEVVETQRGLRLRPYADRTFRDILTQQIPVSQPTDSEILASIARGSKSVARRVLDRHPEFVFPQNIAEHGLDVLFGMHRKVVGDLLTEVLRGEITPDDL